MQREGFGIIVTTIPFPALVFSQAPVVTSAAEVVIVCRVITCIYPFQASRGMEQVED